jgi:hypothetical protein
LFVLYTTVASSVIKLAVAAQKKYNLQKLNDKVIKEWFCKIREEM